MRFPFLFYIRSVEKNILSNIMDTEMIKMLIAMSDADGVYTMMRDMGEDEMADWIEENYFD